MSDKKKIVIIDDEEDICSMTQFILQKTGLYEVATASNGEAGLALCRQVIPDLLVLDYVMPGMQGRDVIDALRGEQTTRGIPIILVSGLGEVVYFGEDDVWRWQPDRAVVQERGDVSEVVKCLMAPQEVAEKFGIRAFLSKPFTKASFLHAVEKILGQPPDSP